MEETEIDLTQKKERLVFRELEISFLFEEGLEKSNPII
jgi:hypothetical protein